MKIAFIFPLLFIVFSCSDTKVQPDDILLENHIQDEQSKFEFQELLIRDIGKLAKKATHETKTDSKFDEHYQTLLKQHELMFYYPSKTSDTIYFAINRITSSLYGKKVAIGGKVILGKERDIKFLEETFRTYKMPVDELQEKTEMLFLKMVNGDDLKTYEYINSKPEEYIEFPDEFTSYNSEDRKWETTREVYYGS